MSEQFLNQKQLARRWGLSPRTLERWRWQGRGPSYLKLVGRVVYRHEDVAAFEADQLRAGGSALVGTVKIAPIRPSPNGRPHNSVHHHTA